MYDRCSCILALMEQLQDTWQRRQTRREEMRRNEKKNTSGAVRARVFLLRTGARVKVVDIRPNLDNSAYCLTRFV